MYLLIVFEVVKVKIFRDKVMRRFYFVVEKIGWERLSDGIKVIL